MLNNMTIGNYGEVTLTQQFGVQYVETFQTGTHFAGKEWVDFDGFDGVIPALDSL